MVESTGDVAVALEALPQPANDGVCFAARASGLYRSDDGGASWRPAYAGLGLDAPLAATTVTLSPAFADDRTLLAGANGGVLRSEDGGESWQAATFADPAPLVTALGFSPAFANDRVALAGTLDDGVFRSSDGGRSWHAWNFGLLDRHVLCLAISPAFASDQTVLAGTGTGLFRSRNGGRSWRELALPCGCAPALCVALAAGAIIVGTEGAGCYRSDDDGRSWRRLGPEILISAVNAIAADDTGRLLVLHDDALLGSDDGTSWTAILPAGVTAMAAPEGPGGPLLVGLADSAVVWALLWPGAPWTQRAVSLPGGRR